MSNKAVYYYYEACIGKVFVTEVVVTLVAKARYKILFNPLHVKVYGTQIANFLFRETEVQVVKNSLKCQEWQVSGGNGKISVGIPCQVLLVVGAFHAVLFVVVLRKMAHKLLVHLGYFAQ